MDGKIGTRGMWGWALFFSALVHLLLLAGFATWRKDATQTPRAKHWDTGVQYFLPRQGGDPYLLDGPGPGDLHAPLAQITPVNIPLQGQPGSGANLPSSKDSKSGPGGAPGTSGVGQGPASFFHIVTEAKTLVFVLDASASMGQKGAWRRACAELESCLRRLPPEVRFQILVFNSVCVPLLPRHPGWLTPTPEILEETSLVLALRVPEGKTEHGPALRLALALRPDVVFFLTDADDLTPEHQRTATLFNQGRSVIHTVELTQVNRLRTGMPLQTLARNNRGEYRAVAIFDHESK
jgi:hypothetical protein